MDLDRYFAALDAGMDAGEQGTGGADELDMAEAWVDTHPTPDRSRADAVHQWLLEYYLAASW